MSDIKTLKLLRYETPGDLFIIVLEGCFQFDHVFSFFRVNNNLSDKLVYCWQNNKKIIKVQINMVSHKRLNTLIIKTAVIFFVMVVYYIVEETIEIKKWRFTYFNSFWNILDLIVIAVRAPSP